MIQRILEIRRHAPTRKGDAAPHPGAYQLSAEGARRARQVATRMPAFDAVFVSPVPRTRETALAMGYAVDGVLENLARMTDDFWSEVGRHDHWSWPGVFSRYAGLLAARGPVRRVAEMDLALIREQLCSTAGNVLIVSHGHAIEAFSVLVAGPERLSGRPFAHLEGVRFRVSEDATLTLDLVLREPPNQAAHLT